MPLEDFLGIKLISGKPEQGRQNNQFLIRDVAQARFNLPERGPAYVQPGQLAAGSKLLLRHPQFLTRLPNLGADNVSWIFLPGHGQKSNLTLTATPSLIVTPA